MRSRRSFESVYRRYHQSLYRYCFSIVGNAEDAQDALQNAMLKAMRALPGERREIKLKPWLYRIAHNESIELLRKRRDEARIDPELVASAAEPAETAAQRERLRRLLGDLSELPDRQRAALVMRELGGLEFAQIGEAFGTSAAVARQTVYEARLGLRRLEAGREMSCETVMQQLSDADGRVTRRRDIKAHLRACPDCRAFRDAIDGRRHDLAALAPLPLVASTGILHALLGSTGAHAGAGAGLTGSVGAGAGKAVATSAVVKGVATVAVVAAVGVTAADRSGLIDAGLPGGSAGTTAREATPAGTGVPAASDSRLPASDNASSGVAGAANQASDSKHPGKAGAGDAAAPGKGKGNLNAGEGNGHDAPATLPAASKHGQETAAEHKANSTPHAAKSHGHAGAASHSAHKGSSHSHAAVHSHGGGGRHSHSGTGSSHTGGSGAGHPHHQPPRVEQQPKPSQPATGEAQSDETQAATGQNAGADSRQGETSP
jgi:RNA polymerase sigma factor (sigma-70 family)